MNATLLALLNLHFPGWQTDEAIQALPAFDDMVCNHVRKTKVKYTATLKQIVRYSGSKHPFFITVT
jgi:hypothetical protein